MLLATIVWARRCARVEAAASAAGSPAGGADDPASHTSESAAVPLTPGA